MRRRSASSIVASPLLVGAITVLVVIVAVFLAYQANSGLPFVPTYDVSAELAGGQNLVKGGEVRVGGFRVGVVESVRTARTRDRAGRERSIAVIDLKLEKSVAPLARDTRVLVRPRSPLGLKYVELTPGTSPSKVPAGGTLPLENSGDPVEFDDLFSTFDLKTREYARRSLYGFGDALAGRGRSLNEAIERFVPFFRHLTPVMRTLSDPRTRLGRLIPELAALSSQLRPVAAVQARLFGEMADTFEAIGHDPGALRATIERSPPTLDVAIASFPPQIVLLTDFADLSRRLRPPARAFRTYLAPFERALSAGAGVLPTTVPLSDRTGQVFDALDRLAQEPSTLLALQDLHNAVRVTGPLVAYIAPYQTVCSYANSWFAGLAGDVSEETDTGTAQRALLKQDNDSQDSRLTNYPVPITAGIPKDQDPKTATTGGPQPAPLVALHAQPYGPAIDAQGNADCQAGQYGYLDELAHGARDYGPDVRHVVLDPDTPGLAGPTFNGVKRLKDVP